MDVFERAQMSPEEERRHWWIRTRFLYLAECFAGLTAPVSALEVGSGTGQNLWYIRKRPELSRKVYRLTGVEPALPPDAAHESWMGPSDAIYRSLEKISDEQDVVIAMDVLEHVDDDVSALKEWVSFLKLRGHGFLTVPALPGLWSHHDELLGHKRRYTVASLKKLIVDAGLEPMKVRYAFAPVVPLVYLTRKILTRRGARRDETDLKPVYPVLNFALYGAGYLEAAMGGNRYLGTSVLGYFKKPGRDA